MKHVGVSSVHMACNSHTEIWGILVRAILEAAFNQCIARSDILVLAFTTLGPCVLISKQMKHGI